MKSSKFRLPILLNFRPSSSIAIPSHFTSSSTFLVLVVLVSSCHGSQYDPQHQTQQQQYIPYRSPAGPSSRFSGYPTASHYFSSSSGGGGSSYRPSTSYDSVYQHLHTPYQPYYKYYSQPKEYIPKPQYCPETGRTVCSKVTPYYPTDEVFSIITLARAKRFNITSEFFDESENDLEPHLDLDEPEPQEPSSNLEFGAKNPPPPPAPVQHYHNIDYKYYRSAVSPPQSTKSMYSYPAAYHTHQRQKRQAEQEMPIEPLCPSRVILIEPKAALNDRRQWKFIVNLSDRDPRLKQAIKVEVCT